MLAYPEVQCVMPGPQALIRPHSTHSRAQPEGISLFAAVCHRVSIYLEFRHKPVVSPVDGFKHIYVCVCVCVCHTGTAFS